MDVCLSLLCWSVRACDLSRVELHLGKAPAPTQPSVQDEEYKKIKGWIPVEQLCFIHYSRLFSELRKRLIKPSILSLQLSFRFLTLTFYGTFHMF